MRCDVGKTRDVVTKVKSPHRLKPSSSSTSKEGEAATGVMVNGYWFPSLEAAAEAPASNGFDFSKAAEVAASTERERQERVVSGVKRPGAGGRDKEEMPAVGATRSRISTEA